MATNNRRDPGARFPEFIPSTHWDPGFTDQVFVVTEEAPAD